MMMLGTDGRRERAERFAYESQQAMDGWALKRCFFLAISYGVKKNLIN